MGKYPKNFRTLAEQFSDVMDKHAALGEAAHKAGPLKGKTAHLIQLAAAAATRSEGAVHSHVRRALEAGGKPEEVFHALILLVSTIGFPATAAAMSWAREAIQSDEVSGRKVGKGKEATGPKKKKKAGK